MNELVNIVEQIHKDVDYIHLREKKWTANDYIQAIKMLNDRSISLQKIIVNDRVDIAYVMNCFGVQLPTHSIHLPLVKRYFKNLSIGCSVHSVDEAIEKRKLGAHYVLYGHIYETKSKENVSPRGIDALSRVVQAIDIPVIAIGGIKPENVEEVILAGAKGIAVLSGILLAKDPINEVKRYRKELDKGGENV